MILWTRLDYIYCQNISLKWILYKRKIGAITNNISLGPNEEAQDIDLLKSDIETKVCVGDKVIKVCEESQLLCRYLIIQGSFPELVPKLEETVVPYDMSVVPYSLCVADGPLYMPGVKSGLMHVVKHAKIHWLPSTLVIGKVPVRWSNSPGLHYWCHDSASEQEENSCY